VESLGVGARIGVEVNRFETNEQGETRFVARPWPHREHSPELCFLAGTVIIALGLRGTSRRAGRGVGGLRGRKGIVGKVMGE
jgi:hypothetical protein